VNAGAKVNRPQAGGYNIPETLITASGAETV
jgi:hypothetical protein